MYFVDNGKDNYDASLNIALETYLVENPLVDEPILLFYINDPSIIIGRNQNTIEEINQEYVEKHGIQVVRRMSGGGAVYHDRGNFSFCFIKDDDGSFRDFASFTAPVIDALHKLGVEDAHLEGRNDLLIGDQKFSGNAMYAKDGRMTAHGTILYDADLEAVNAALNPNKQKIESKGIKSVRSRVTNIRPFVDDQYKDLTTEEFRDRILLEVFDVDDRSQVKELILTDEDWEKVYEIQKKRFGNWDWNYGQSPEFTVQVDHKYLFGLVDIRLDVDQGVVHQAKIFGDFFGLGNISDVEEALVGTKYTKEEIQKVLEELDLVRYIGNITAEELTTLIFS